MSFKVDVTGLDKALKNIAKLPSRFKQEVEDEIDVAAETVRADAIGNVPVDTGFLKGRITVVRGGEMTREVVAQSKYAAWVEFGTMTKVSVPAELVTYAQTFKGSQGGKGDAKQMIYEWCRRQGIPKERWWFIYKSIMSKGIRPQPYLYPAFFNEIPKLTKRLVNALTNAYK